MINTRKVIQKKKQELMIYKVRLEEYLEGGRRQQKIWGIVLTVVRNSGRTSRPIVDIIRQPGLESSIGKVVVRCKYPQ